jgi:hypothetical protein
MPFDLSAVREDVYRFMDERLDKDGPYGCYRSGVRKRPDLYSSCDMAWIRGIFREDLLKLPQNHRQEWIDTINSYVHMSYGKPVDGGYFDSLGSSKLHANGMVIGALAMLGGKQRYPVKLYDEFNTVEKIEGWLERIDWEGQWSGSHLFWGGMHCFSFSKACTPAWREKVFAWLDANLDEKTGWWRKGVPHSDRHQPLGGSVHIVPIYEHHGRRFPYPERVIDSVIALQLPNGRWHTTDWFFAMNYLELDALYALQLMKQWAPGYRTGDIAKTVEKFAKTATECYAAKKAEIYRLHPHYTLAMVGCFGLLQQLDPDGFRDSVQWTDIFSDKRFYDTAAVEVEK